MKNYYTLESVENLINECTKIGYEIIQLEEGSLALGKMVLVSPDEKHWNFVINEEYINPCNSGITLRRCRKLSKKLQAEIDAA